MAKFAPVYMKSYDGPEYDPFEDLTISNDEIEEGSAADTLIGTLSGMADAEDSSLSLVDVNGNPYTGNIVALDGNDLVTTAGFAALPDGTYEVYVRETNPWVSGQTHDTNITVTITPAA